MKTRVPLLFVLVISCIITLGQRTAIELAFTAVNNTAYVQMDSIRVMNRSQGGETVLIWPDTVLSVLWVGIPEPEDISGFHLYQNFPNPVGDQTTINLSIPDYDRVNIIVTDVIGRTVCNRDIVLPGGMHSLLFIPGMGSVYFLTATYRGSRQTCKILHYGITGNQKSWVEYAGQISSLPEHLKVYGSTRDFIINPGDDLLYIGYADNLESGILDSPEESQTYTFQFATNIPCPGMPTVEYEGQVYNTIQIFSQCWLKENLNVGIMIPGNQEMGINGIIEKYCYNNSSDSCIKYGGLYQWGEVMQYSSQYGIQGICPSGWHVPTDEEWKVLEGAVDNNYGIGFSVWDLYGLRGYDAGKKIKTTTGWIGAGNGTDLFSFTGEPNGGRDLDGSFKGISKVGLWWSSTGSDNDISIYRGLYWDSHLIRRQFDDKIYGEGVRCLRDY